MFESMDSLNIIEGQKIVETTVSFFSKRTIESMDSLAVIHRKNIAETTVRFSIK